MSVSKLHPSLPAPVVHNSHMPPSASKSHVLAGVQDAYWSDDEQENEECPLCLEEMDLSDLNFKPCPCGYQICRFCWHHIKENLNGRCPACRREYSDDAVQFKPVNKEDLKRLTQQKRHRERERKDLDALGRRHLTNVRIVQRNVVYVVGLGSRFAKEELIPTLRSTEYFGQYGKITKMLLVKRTPPGGQTPILGLYISYYRREDAARTIQAVDGTPSPSGGGELLRASYGTTKYCIAFLRGVSCTNHGCMDLHEWGDERDCFTKEDLTTLKHTMKDTENRQRSTVTLRKSEDGGGLPRSAGWGARPLAATSVANATSGRGSRRGQRSTKPSVQSENRTQPTTAARQSVQTERKQPAKPPSQASSSRPSTPGILPQRPTTPASAVPNSRQQKQRKESQVPVPPRSPTSSIAVESDVGSLEAASASPSLSASRVATPPVATSEAPPGLSGAPPGLSSPPHDISGPGQTQASSPLVHEASTSSYQISSQAQALLDDVVNRRESLPPSTSLSPFPDLDRTLQSLAGGDGDSGGFNFSLDPKLAVDDEQFDDPLLDLDIDQSLASSGHFNPFSTGQLLNEASTFNPPPEFAFGIPPSRGVYEGYRTAGLDKTTPGSSGYMGSFNPFGGASESAPQSNAQRPSPIPDDDATRRVSRFGFARERQGSAGFLNSGRSSPLLSANTSLSSLSLADNTHPSSSASSHPPWAFQRQHEFAPPPGLGMPARTDTPGSVRGSPLVPYTHAQTAAQTSYVAQTSRFQPFDMSSSEASLNDILGIGRDVGQHGRQPGPTDNQQPTMLPASGISFQDPAIMSSIPYMSPPGNDGGFHFSPPAESGYLSQSPMNKPPGLAFQQNQHFSSHQGPSHVEQFQSSMALGNGPFNSPMAPQGQIQNQGHLARAPSPSSVPPSLFSERHLSLDPSPGQSPMLSAADFPALPTACTGSDTQSQPRTSQSALQTRDSSPVKDEQVQAKLDKKAEKKAAAAERAAERARIAKEKAAERERLAKEKAGERERAAKARVEEKERITKQKAEKERLAKEKADREAEKERAEKERLAALRKAEADKAVEKAEKKKAQAKVKQAQRAAEKTDASSSDSKKSQPGAAVPTESTSPMPILSKLPKKNKPMTKPLKIPKETDSNRDPQSSVPSTVTTNSEAPRLPTPKLSNVSEVTRSSLETDVVSRASSDGAKRKSIAQLLEEISLGKGPYYLDNHPFFDMSKINSATKLSLDYGTMSRALSAFPSSGASFADGSSRLNDQTVASFQQLLETLTQTMSDLVQLLPQSTWGSSTSFDGLVHDDLPDDAEDDEDFDDMIAEPPTPTIDKRAKWMEIQLAKLEELHREVNIAAIRTILASNDQGWDTKGFLPHVGNTLARFQNLGFVDEGGQKRPMMIEELEKKLVVAKEASVFAEAELREAMQAMQADKPLPASCSAIRLSACLASQEMLVSLKSSFRLRSSVLFIFTIFCILLLNNLQSKNRLLDPPSQRMTGLDANAFNNSSIVKGTGVQITGYWKEVRASLGLSSLPGTIFIPNGFDLRTGDIDGGGSAMIEDADDRNLRLSGRLNPALRRRRIDSVPGSPGMSFQSQRVDAPNSFWEPRSERSHAHSANSDTSEAGDSKFARKPTEYPDLFIRSEAPSTPRTPVGALAASFRAIAVQELKGKEYLKLRDRLFR
ncbi:NOT4 [Sanghuangporus weigelae]